VSKGVLQRVEKTVPLDKITDVGIVQGPIMRYLGLEALSVETAGQSSQGALVKLIGIVDTRQFRAAIIRQRDVVAVGLAEGPRPSGASPALGESPSEDVLVDIRDTLRRIEQHLGGNKDG
jgi:putative membrane protein